MRELLIMTPTTVAPGPESHLAPPRLSAISFTLCLIVLLAIFVLLNPIWVEQDMRAWNENIWWSYIPIPLLVAIFLAIERKLGLAALLLESMKLTFVKFVITITFANVLWGVSGVPDSGIPETPRAETDAVQAAFQPVAPPTPTSLDEQSLGQLSGTVVAPDGAPVAGALVWISKGLETYVFAPPAATLVLNNHGTGIEPTFAVVQVWQSISLCSSDDLLHTIVITDGSDRRLANYPMLGHDGRELMFHRQHGLIDIGCSVHSDESSARFLVLANPFHTRTAADGSFTLTGVPAGELQLEAWSPTGQAMLDGVSLPVSGALDSLRLQWNRKSDYQ
ncbi:MAG: succinate dehydrogenase hydrophobic anchor subunit [Planctomycetota bacterium]|jgi:succinate dehydrogenase hydrophobic anchor subunit